MRHSFIHNRRFSLLVIFAVVVAFSYARTKRTVHVAAAGTLSNYISEAEKYKIEELTLTGELNGTDFRLLRDMAGNNYQGQITNGKLVKLDISGAKIVEGGYKYLETNRIYFLNGGYWGREFYLSTQNEDFGSFLFAGCNVLQEVVLPKSLKRISNNAFVHNTNLESLVIPQNVSYIGNQIINSCNNIKSIYVEEGNVIYDSRDGCNAIIETATNKLIVGCKGTIIPEGITEIGNFAFYSCSELTSLKIPSSVEIIGEYNQEIKGKTNVEIIPVSA